MKASMVKIVALAMLAMCASPALGMRLVQPQQHKHELSKDVSTHHMQPMKIELAGVSASVAPLATVTVGAGALCNLCIQMAVAGINALLNIILNSGVVGSCGELCGQLPKSLEVEACNVVCDAVGIYGFIKAIEKADIDPIYFCELLSKADLDICPIQDCPAGNPSCQKIQQLEVTPPTGPQGTDFKIAVVMNGTAPVGTGEIKFTLCPPGAKSEDDCNEQSSFVTGYPAGMYGFGIDFDTAAAEGAQPAPAGDYLFSIEVCEGLCMPNPPRNPHEYNFCEKSVKFTVTPK